MSDKVLNPRQIKILTSMEFDKEYALRDMKDFFVKIPSIATLRRDISNLRNRGFLKQIGDLKSSRYSLTVLGMLLAPIDAHEYCSIEVDKRRGNSRVNNPPAEPEALNRILMWGAP